MSEESKGEDHRLSSFNAEESRIRAVYTRREAVVDRQLYSYFNPGNLFIIQDRERQILSLLKQHGCGAMEGQKILEVGCGTGYWLRVLINWGARPENLVGVDLIPERIVEAQKLCPASATLRVGNAVRLEFPEASFDLVLQSTVFSSILDADVRMRIAREMLRVLKPGGSVLWYDFFVKKPRNPDVKGMKKKEILRLFPNCDVILRRVTLAPPLARTLASHGWLLCSCLAALRFLDTHYLALIRPKGGA